MTNLVAVETSWWRRPVELLELQFEWMWLMVCGDVDVLGWLEKQNEMWQLCELVAVRTVTSQWCSQREVVKLESKCQSAAVKPVTSGLTARC